MSERPHVHVRIDKAQFENLWNAKIDRITTDPKGVYPLDFRFDPVLLIDPLNDNTGRRVVSNLVSTENTRSGQIVLHLSPTGKVVPGESIQPY